MSIDFKELARRISVEIEGEARKLHARMAANEMEIITQLGELTAQTIYKETVGGEPRDPEDWAAIEAITHNVVTADRLLFQRKVTDLGKMFFGAIKTVLPLLG